MKSRFKTHFLPTKQHAGNKIPSLVLIFFVVVVGCTSTHVGMGDVQRWEQEGNLQQLKAQQYKGSKQSSIFTS
jgi:p-aminobenzoyl-glutamate transporter AbgT